MATIIDITDIASYLEAGTTGTGIQRVVVQLAVNALRVGDPQTPVLLGRHDAADGTYHVTEATSLLGHEQIDLRRFGERLGLNHKAPAPPSMTRYTPGSPKYRYHSFRREMAARRGDTEFFRRRGTTLDAWRAWREDPDPSVVARWQALDSHPATAGGRNDFFLPGSLWGDDAAEAFFEARAAAGDGVTYLVHDLIPHRAPELAPPDTAADFERWLDHATSIATGLIGISDATILDLRGYLADKGRDVPIHKVPLAQAGLTDPVEAEPDRARALGRVGHRARLASVVPYALFVGTVEARKNVWRMIQAWDQAIRAGRTDFPRLVIAGRNGYLCDDVHDIVQLGSLGGWIARVESPSDADLDHLYRNCAFTILPSLYEGWGLPVGEGFSYGKTGVLSDSSSLPEVGKDLVAYCDPLSIASIREAVETLVDPAGRRAELEARIAATDLRTWRDAAADMVAAVRRADR